MVTVRWRCRRPDGWTIWEFLDTGVSEDLEDGRPVATETFGIGRGDAVHGFGETFLGLDKTGQTVDLWVSDAMGAHTPRCYKRTPYLVEGTRLHDRLARAGGFVRSPAGNVLDVGVHFVRGYRGRVHVVDWTNPEAVRVMAEEYRRLFATGASVVKVDFGEELPAEAVDADGTPVELRT